MTPEEPVLIRRERLGTWWMAWSACLVVGGVLLGASGWFAHPRGGFAYLCLAVGAWLIPFGLVALGTGIGLRRGWAWALRACRPLAILHAFHGPVGMGVAFVTFAAFHKWRRPPVEDTFEPPPGAPALDEMKTVLHAGMPREAFFDALDEIAMSRGLRLRLGASPDQVAIPVAEGGELLCFLTDRGLTYVEYRGGVFLELEPV